MKKIILLFILYNISVQTYSQDECVISGLDIYAYPYVREYIISPSIEEIKQNEGLYVKVQNCSDVYDSRIKYRIDELELRSSEPYNTDEAEWTSKAIVTIHYNDSTKKTENLYLMKRGIVWKNRRYDNYDPLIESVYYFYPDRYLDGGY